VQGRFAAGVRKHKKKLLAGAGLLAVAGSSAYALTSPVAAPYIGSRVAALSLKTERASLARAMQATSLAEQDQRFTKLEKNLAGTAQLADLAMRKLDQRTSKMAQAEFKRAMATKVRARRLLRSVKEIKTRSGVTLSREGFQFRN
jgi:hypothetical protein